MSEIKFIAGIVAFIVAVMIGVLFLVSAVYSNGERFAEKTCSALGAEPVYTHRTHFICVTSDGRIVGHG